MLRMDGRIVAIGLAVTSGLIYTRAFENEFFKDIILVAIPAIIGLFVIKRVPNEWQQYRFKVSLKKEILDLFENSVKRGFVAQDTITRQLGHHYAKSEESIDSDTGEIDLHIDFPTEINEQPLIALKDEYEEFKKEIGDRRLDGEKLVSKMRLYFDSKEMEQEFLKINILSGKCSQHIRLAFESTNQENFLKNLNTFHEESKTLRNLLDKFENKLARQKIRKIAV